MNIYRERMSTNKDDNRKSEVPPKQETEGKGKSPDLIHEEDGVKVHAGATSRGPSPARNKITTKEEKSPIEEAKRPDQAKKRVEDDSVQHNAAARTRIAELETRLASKDELLREVLGALRDYRALTASVVTPGAD